MVGSDTLVQISVSVAVFIHQIWYCFESSDALGWGKQRWVGFHFNESMSVHSYRRWIGKTLQQLMSHLVTSYPGICQQHLTGAVTFGINRPFHFQRYFIFFPFHLLKLHYLLTCLCLCCKANLGSCHPATWFLSSVSLISHSAFHLPFSFRISIHFPTPTLFWCHVLHASIFSSNSVHTIQQNPCPHHLMPLFTLSPLPPGSVISSPPSIPPNTFFRSSIHLWSHSSPTLSTSDPSFPHFPTLWSLCSPELWGTSLCVSCLCRSLHVWWPQGRDDTDPLEWEGTESGRSSKNALLNPVQYTMSSS